ncbi:DUF502 domain-containing protein [Halolamina sp. CBA1230]|uniref:DUF502 domain-containing protein n=1 Tax=Halolamina sp. CBA1230 TaxID=1853690 RepID=UPI0009A15C33|nr:DUF502 domain-containing protein [Halolamina sp. CBA1230]QKY21230.1 DUF502 domain-containing protein [Halolamina sp. CBA1230]
MTRWKRDFASGLIVVLPVLVLLFVLDWLIGHLLGLPLNVPPDRIPPGLVPSPITVEAAAMALELGLTLGLFLSVTLAAGYLMRTQMGRIAEGLFDDIVNRVPGVRVLYNASKLAVETAVSGASELQKPVKLEPWNGMRMTAFKTGQKTADGRDVLFMPTAPNITTGFVVEVEPDDYEETDESVEEALTRVLSAGFGESNETEIPVTDALAGDDEEQ